MIHKKLAALACLISTLSVSHAYGTTIPFGVQNDVLLSDVTGSWGWTEIYRGGYDVDSVSIADMFAGHGEWVMIGGMATGSSTIDVLAAVRWSDFIIHTARHVTHEANGAEWYNNGGSLGFAGLGDSINQGQADTNGSTERDRLSWHTNAGGGFIGEYTALATHVRFGWRSGDNTNLNYNPNWQKVVFTLDEVSRVPDAGSSLALMGAGLLSLFALRRRIR